MKARVVLRSSVARLLPIAVISGLLGAAVSAATTTVAFANPGVTTFVYTGAVQTYTVPADVNYVTIETWGAQGNAPGEHGLGGLGGHVKATLPVIPGEALSIRVGGMNGFNGGGAGRVDDCESNYGCDGGGDIDASGGGATDVRQGGDALEDRMVVAGGGGGNGSELNPCSGFCNGTGLIPGGVGGGTDGGSGASGGAGGTQTSGYQLGTGESATPASFGGGGGGGWYGGFAGTRTVTSGTYWRESGGGGGSGHVDSSAITLVNDAGVRSGDGLATIQSSVPSAPGSPAATPADGVATVQWLAPVTDNGLAIDGYYVTPYTSGGASLASEFFPGTSTTHDLSGLNNGTTYWFAIEAENAAGIGQYSNTAPITVGAPTAPSSLAGAPGNGTASLSWLAPASNSGAVVQDYAATTYFGGAVVSQTVFGATATTGTVAGLTNGRTYSFKIAARNSRGSGVQSSAVTLTVGTPSVPHTVAAAPGYGQVTLSWSTPVSNNGSTISGYTVIPYKAGLAQSPRVFYSAATTQAITSLTNGITYAFKVAARNARGTGPYSTATAPVVVGTPTAPGSPSASTGNHQATVTWLVPADDGGSPITGYVVTPYRSGVAQTGRTFNSTATTQNMTGLMNGVTYTFKVAAKNARGTGAQSISTAPITVGVPAPPRSPTAAPRSAGAVVSWAVPLADNGSPITGYVITPFLAGVAGSPLVFNSTATSQIVSGLTNANTYTFKVAAKNTNGTGLQSVSYRRHRRWYPDRAERSDSHRRHCRRPPCTGPRPR